MLSCVGGLRPGLTGNGPRRRPSRAGDLPEPERGCNGAGQPFSAAGLATARWLALGPNCARLCIAKQNERRNAFEFFRDHAAELFWVATGSVWRPRSGSILNHRTLTAAMIDSRDFLAGRHRADTKLLVPAGTRIALSGGTEYNDHQRIWDALDRVRAKHPDMVLLHGGSPRGAERIAACWADHRKVTQVVFKPDWAKHRNAAPFKRYDQMLEALPIGLIVFPGSGITANLADKARKMGIPLWRFPARDAA
jgi:hypothetical protein